MTALICGSFAFDTIMVFKDRFQNHILPEKVHMLNVSFTVPDLRREFGGCGGNIIYNLQLLGGDGIPLGTVGQDFEPYARWLQQHGIETSHLRVIDDAYTAQAFITTDLSDNQITAFHPGAMAFSAQVPVPRELDIDLAIVAPDSREGMLRHATELADAGIPFIFDPGQAMPLFNGEELLDFITKATYVAVNDYECELLQERTGLNLSALASQVEALIVTRGAQGSEIHTAGNCLRIPAANAARVVDPTGCGDAYRAGLIYGLRHGVSWETTGKIAALLGALKIEQHGTQNHSFTLDDFQQRFEQEFGHRF